MSISSSALDEWGATDDVGCLSLSLFYSPPLFTAHIHFRGGEIGGSNRTAAAADEQQKEAELIVVQGVMIMGERENQCPAAADDENGKEKWRKRWRKKEEQDSARDADREKNEEEVVQMTSESARKFWILKLLLSWSWS